MRTTVTRQLFGRMADGTSVDVFALTEGKIEARITTYGGILVFLRIPDKTGNVDDVVLGFDTLEEYVEVFNSQANPFFGAIIGRYANRIARGRFTLAGKNYSVPVNNRPNSLHGGPHGFHNVIWSGKEIENGVELSYLSKDGEAGYPGNLSVKVRYTLQRSALTIEYLATTDQLTVVNLSHHSYFNLCGQSRGDILSHQLTLHASRFTPVDSTLIPTGELRPVASTPFDFRESRPIGERIDADDQQLLFAKGYDHSWVLDSSGEDLTLAAEVHEPISGRVLQVSTTQPGVQFYSGNSLDGTLTGKGGAKYVRRGGLSLETQHFPDSPNHAEFPSTELRPGERYHHRTVYRFSVR